MRAFWIVVTLLALPGLAQGSDALPFVSGANQCEIAQFLGVAPPQACPHVAQSGTAWPTGCAGDRCVVHLEAGAVAQGLLPAGSREVLVETQIADASEPAVQSCVFDGSGLDVSCDGLADLDLPVAVGACTPFRVRATLSDLGDAGATFAYRLVTERALEACRDAVGDLSVRLG